MIQYVTLWFQLLRPNTLFFFFFPRLFLWYARVEKLIWQYSRVENRCVGGVDIKRLNEFRC